MAGRLNPRCVGRTAYRRRASEHNVNSSFLTCRKAAMGRIRSFVTVRDFSLVATCYAELNGRVRPLAATGVVDLI